MIRATAIAAALALPLFAAIDVLAGPAAAQAVLNPGTVELETAGSGGISVRIAEDIANLVDDGATRRVLPVVGKGSLQNLMDLRFLRGIDVAILQTDVLDYAKEQKLYPGVESSINYIAKLYNEEFHLLARRDIDSIADLANQKVNIDLPGSGTAVTATRLFAMLKVPVQAITDPPEAALEKLRDGEIAALAFVAGKPAPLFTASKADGLHLIPIPLNDELTAAGYLPTRLSAADYPGLVSSETPVDTIAVGAVLAVAELRLVPERSRNIANFIDSLFTGFPSLLTPGHHPKWREVSLAAEVPGWRRNPAAEQWLERNMQVASGPNPDDLRLMFSRFIDERRRASGATPMPDAEKDTLFQQFQHWQSDSAR